MGILFPSIWPSGIGEKELSSLPGLLPLPQPDVDSAEAPVMALLSVFSESEGRCNKSDREIPP